MELKDYPELLVHQRFEHFELLGYETRNKYEILDHNKEQLAFAAEQQKGLFGFFARQMLGHWRKFDIHFFTKDRQEFMLAHHPFRWFFQRLEIKRPDGSLFGALQQRFSLLYKKFDVIDSTGRVIFQVQSPLWRIWTFPVLDRGREVACIKKQWGGLLAEGFTDRDKFQVSFAESSLSNDQRLILLAASVFIDLLYFERKAQS